MGAGVRVEIISKPPGWGMPSLAEKSCAGGMPKPAEEKRSGEKRFFRGDSVGSQRGKVPGELATFAT
jgi:hypothetical protein